MVLPSDCKGNIEDPFIGLNFQKSIENKSWILDAFGDPKSFGKQVGGDIIENKIKDKYSLKDSIGIIFFNSFKLVIGSVFLCLAVSLLAGFSLISSGDLRSKYLTVTSSSILAITISPFLISWVFFTAIRSSSIIPGKEKVVKELRAAAKKVDHIYLATDLDREGEAIAWHLKEALGPNKHEFSRVRFNQITKNSIIDSFADPKEIDIDLVNAQQAQYY